MSSNSSSLIDFTFNALPGLTMMRFQPAAAQRLAHRRLAHAEPLARSSARKPRAWLSVFVTIASRSTI